MGQRVEIQEFYVETADHSTDSNTSFVGKANVNSDGDTSRPIWQITKFTETGSAFSKTYADGDIKFDNIWDNRESLTYK